MVEVLKSKIQMARKEHICNYCGQKIPENELYFYAFCVDGGDAYAHKSHTYCSGLASYLDMFDHCHEEGLTDDVFQECIWEYVKGEMGRDNVVHMSFPDVLNEARRLKLQGVR